MIITSEFLPSFVSIANLQFGFNHKWGKLQAKERNYFPNDYTVITSDEWSTIKLFLTFPQITSIKLKPFKSSALLIATELNI